MSALNYDATSRDEVERLSNQYFSIIPHAFGRNRPPVIRDINLLKKEIELLESLSDMKETAAMLKDQLKDKSDVNKLDKQFQGLGMNEMSPLDHKSREFVEIDEYLNNSRRIRTLRQEQVLKDRQQSSSTLARIPCYQLWWYSGSRSQDCPT